MAQTPATPRIEEAYALAQCIAADRRSALELVERAHRALGSRDPGRFALLRSVIRVSGLTFVGTIEPDDPADRGASPTTGTPVSYVGIQAGREVRNRLLPAVLALLDPRIRVVAWLGAAGVTSPADLGRVLDLEPEDAARLRHEADARVISGLERAAAPHERVLLRAAEAAEPTRDAVRRLMDSLLEPAPAELARRLAPASPDERIPDRRDSRGAFRRLALLLFIVLAASAVGYTIQALRSEPAPESGPRASDAVRSAIAAVDDAEPAFRTSSAEQTEVFIRDRLGWSVITPIVAGHPLEGVSIVTVRDDLEAPVLFYAGPDGRDLAVVVYTYAFLERATPILYLDGDLRRQISEAGRFSLLDTGDVRALIFRNRDDIFVAVTGDDTDALQDAITFPG